MKHFSRTSPHRWLHLHSVDLLRCQQTKTNQFNQWPIFGRLKSQTVAMNRSEVCTTRTDHRKKRQTTCYHLAPTPIVQPNHCRSSSRCWSYSYCRPVQPLPETACELPKKIKQQPLLAAEKPKCDLQFSLSPLSFSLFSIFPPKHRNHLLKRIR